MILKKMTEYNEQGIKEESFILIIEDRDEGWELSRKEMLKLQKFVEQSLKEFVEKRESEKIKAPVEKPMIDYLNDPMWQPNPYREKEKTLEFIVQAAKAPEEDQAEECPEYIEPPEHEMICENGACALVLEEVEIVPEKAENLPEIAEEVQKEHEKVQKQDKKIQPEKDYASYVQMVKENKAPRFIRKAMVEDTGMTEGTADNYFYSRVKPEALRQIKEQKDRAIEKKKKRLENHLEKKVQVIPTSPYHGSSERVHFTDEEKERIRRQSGSKM